MNASCASGIFLGACVYQCLLTHPSPPGAVVVSRKRDYCRLFKRGGGVWALPVHTHGHPPKSRPACQTTFVPTIATLDLVSLGLVRCGCGKSVTGHHRQRDGSRRMPASILLGLENTVRQDLERGRCVTRRSDQAHRITRPTSDFPWT